jgi:hypothetical protein
MVVNSRLLRALCCCVLWIGCESGTRSPQLRSGPVAVLSGRVRLPEGAALPIYTAFDVARRPLLTHSQPPAPAECASANERARAAVQLGPERGLAGVVVAASDFTRVRERKPIVISLAIEHCRLQPSVLAAMGGDVVELVNRDAYPFEPLLGPTYESKVLASGEKIRFPLAPGGLETLMCSGAAPCGRSDLMTFFHPVFAVTDAEGRFRIENFPASELVRLTAWHPLFDERESFIWLEPGESTSVELELLPRERFLPPRPSALTTEAGASATSVDTK